MGEDGRRWANDERECDRIVTKNEGVKKYRFRDMEGPWGRKGEGGGERGTENGEGEKGGKRPREKEQQLEVGRSSTQSRESRLEMGLTRMI